ncbi:MAG TPA: flagellar basal-body rod protein FlgF, partial [Porticoccaceae bacterium]|nr:flagellar basal-body rod protein FlgF [Porticoccaceae bacterium]
MDRLLYVAMSGADMASTSQIINGQNLANASTPGFKADTIAFSEALLAGQGYESRSFTRVSKIGTNTEHGKMQATGRDMDVAINGEGWMAVQALDGSEAYTRRGDLRIDSLGLLTNGEGRPILGNGGPIAVPPHAKFEVGSDGTVSILPLGQNPSGLAVVDRIKLVKIDTEFLQKGGDGLMRSTAVEPVLPDASVRVSSGYLEASNVSSVEAMVEMIELARAFEMQIEMMNVAKELDQSTSQLVKMS